MARIEIDVDEFFDEAIGDYRPQMLIVQCSSCGAENSPLPGARVVWSGWRWHGMSHQEPHTDYEIDCRVCQAPIRFTVRSPQ